MPKFDFPAVARERENSKVLVKWVNTEGQSFIEQTETHDISASGISFHLKHPIWLDTHLALTIGGSALFGRLHTTSAKVVRIQTDAAGNQLIAARFDE
jgi:PilZ domain-containing protein